MTHWVKQAHHLRTETTIFYNANGQLASKGFETNLKVSADNLSLYVG